MLHVFLIVILQARCKRSALLILWGNYPEDFVKKRLAQFGKEGLQSWILVQVPCDIPQPLKLIIHRFLDFTQSIQEWPDSSVVLASFRQLDRRDTHIGQPL